MRWPWSKKRLPLLPIPTGANHRPAPPSVDGLIVQELDVSTVEDQDLEALRAAQSQTGLHRAWKRVTSLIEEPRQ